MKNPGKRLKITTVLLVLVMLLGVVPFAQADDEPPPACNPVAEALAAQMEIDCEELIEIMLDQEAGLGEVMQAWYLAQRLENFDGEWTELLDMSLDNGWGQLVKAFTLADQLEGVEAEDLLAAKAEGIGWGQLWKAQAIMLSSADPLTLTEALTELEDMGWGQIKKELEITNGPPPWAKGGNGLALGHNDDADADGSTGPGNSGGNANGHNNGNGNSNGNNGRGQGANGDG